MGIYHFEDCCFLQFLKIFAIDCEVRNVKLLLLGKDNSSNGVSSALNSVESMCFSQCYNTIIETDGSPCCKMPLNAKSSLMGSLSRLKSAKSSPALQVSVRRCFAR